MKTIVCGLLVTAACMVPAAADVLAQQAALDAVCEAARERQLAPMRAYYIEQCVQQRRRVSGDVRAQCERFYADFGQQSGNRAPLFYDLPECVYAFEFRRGNARR